MKVLNYTGLQNLWTNIKNYIIAHTPTKTSDLTNDSNFVDTSNSAVASGITSAKVTDYDTHIADTDIHVTTADKNKWNNQTYAFRYSSTALVASSTNSNALLDNTDNLKVGDKVIDSSGVLFSITAIDTANSTFTIGTALIDLAQDSDVVHKSGDETVGGVKSFSNDTFVKSLNFTREVASPSSSNVALLPIMVNITFTDQSSPQSATLNLRVSADGSKTLYPNENGVYSLGLVSRNWDNVYSYMFESFGKNLGNEFSNNARTNLYLKANRDTGGQSGVYVSKFRQNRAQGEMGDLDVVQVTFDVLENSVRSNRLWYLNWLNWENDVPKTVEVRSFCEKVDYKLTHINGLNPSSLGMPDLNNGIDISGFFDATQISTNTYTAPADGYISLAVSSPNRGSINAVIGSDFWGTTAYGAVNPSDSNSFLQCMFVPILKNQTITVYLRTTGGTLESAKFYPCQGNV